MSHRTRLLTALAVAFSLYAIDAGRDFSGKWILDANRSDVRSLPNAPDPALTVVQDSAIRCSTSSSHWTYTLDGSESRYKLAGADHNSVAKWEGAALLINTLVSGPRQYAVMDRWKLSGDRAVLTINRQVDEGGRHAEGVLIYRREGESASETGVPPARRDQEPATNQPLARREEPLPPPKLTVRAGTRVPLVLLNSVDTKHSREGDRIYLQTQFPITIDNQIVIPRGSSVIGAVTKSKPAGRVQGKGELYIRFDSLTLPNGVTRDFRARLSSADSGNGKVDPQEGKVTGEKDKADAARKVGGGAAGGGSVGVLTGGLAGHPGMGAGIGAAAGGLAGILLSKRADATLPKGTTVEMVLDRDLDFRPDELRF